MPDTLSKQTDHIFGVDLSCISSWGHDKFLKPGEKMIKSLFVQSYGISYYKVQNLLNYHFH